MPIISSNFNDIGNAGQVPGTIRIDTDDTLSTIQSVGYLNVLSHQGLPLSETSMALVGINKGADKSTVWMAIEFSNGNWSLIPSSITPPLGAKYLLQQSNASLPNAQAMSALSTGIVKNTTTTGVQSIAVAGTDYQAPISGLSLSAVTAATDDKILIQDTSDSNILKTTTVQSVLDLVPGGSGVFTQLKTTLSSAQILDLLNTPVLVAPAGGANTLVLINSLTLSGVFNTANYTNGGTMSVAYDGFDGTAMYEDISATAVTLQNRITFPVPIDYPNTVTHTNHVNKGLYIWLGGATPFATGDGTLDVYVTYQVITL